MRKYYCDDKQPSLNGTEANAYTILNTIECNAIQYNTTQYDTILTSYGPGIDQSQHAKSFSHIIMYNTTHNNATQYIANRNNTIQSSVMQSSTMQFLYFKTMLLKNLQILGLCNITFFESSII